MSQENVEVVRRAFAYEVYGRGDRAEVEAIFDPGVVMNPAEEGPSYGIDAIRDNGNRMFLTAHHRGRGRGSGIEVDAQANLEWSRQ